MNFEYRLHSGAMQMCISAEAYYTLCNLSVTEPPQRAGGW